ncbi:MAG: PIN domain-containing protein [Chloroflexi bacterium]|nr:PIN domain-containing protein [Chloroflexota bacterium]
MVNLDTHILIAALEGRINRAEERALDDFWAISAIVFWEIGFLEREGRIAPILDSPDFGRVVNAMTVFPIDVAIARALRSLDFRSDPADEIIAATSLVHGVALLTRDARILSSKVVPLAVS